MTDAADVLEGLDPEQRAAAEALHGPVVVLAGAGTGKTRAITHRIAYGVRTGVHDPRRSLAVTFTARAAGEMRHRLARLGVEGVQARTFHSAALRQLRYFWPQVVGGRVPEVLAHKGKVLTPLLSRAGHGGSAMLRDVAAEIEWAKASQVGAGDYASAAAATGREPPLPADQVAALYAAYEERKGEAGFIDFEDVLLLTVGMLDTRADVAETVRGQYRWFTVDEYQDVNPLQHRLLGLWLGDRDELCVVGDASQTIYTFTGASADYLLGFRREHPHATEVRLVRSYRSTPQIVATANAVLTRAGGKHAAARLELASTREDGPRPTVTAYDDEAGEAAGVAARVRRLLDGGLAPRGVAVLYRINAQSAPYEAAFAEAGIPYLVRGETAYFDRPEVREATIRLRGARLGDDGGEPLGAAVRSTLSVMGWTDAPPAGGVARERWENLLRIVTLADDLAAASPTARIADLVTELDARAAVQATPVADGVTLSTVHAAKGLEWEAVFVVGLQDGSFPISYADTPARVEEERRLLYVALTRARTQLAMSWSRSREAGRGRRERSPFLVGLTRVAVDAGDGSSGGLVRPGGGSRGAKDPARRKRVATCSGCGAALVTGAESARGRCRNCPARYDEDLLAQLKSWRKQAAGERSVPAFVILTDAALELVAECRPGTVEELLAVPGIGRRKADDFGAGLVQAVQDWAAAHR